MKLAVITDLHDSVDHLAVLQEAVRQADALIICGDFTTFGDRARIQRVADAVRAQSAPTFFVLGNCDAMPSDGALDGCVNLHGRLVEWGGWLFAGLGGSLPCPSMTPREFQEAYYAGVLGRIRGECGGRAERLVLVSHQPPFETDADRLPAGRHVGCRALKAFLQEVQPACCLTGHIHEAESRSRVGRTVVLNPGPFSLGRVGLIELGAE